MASLAAFNYMQKEDLALQIGKRQFTWKPLYAKILLIVVVYGGFFFELDYQFIRAEMYFSLRDILLGIYNFGFVIALALLPFFKKNVFLKKMIAGLAVLAIVSYLTTYLSTISIARDKFLFNNEALATGFMVHYVLLLLFLVLVFGVYRGIYKQFGFQSKVGNIALWVLAFIAVYLSSVEVGHLSVMASFDAAESIRYDMAVKNTYPIVWAITALVLMISGMKFKLKTLRLASLVLFLLTIIKLFFYDLAGNSTGKIISFILLGVILLVISFLYQKLKFIIQDDENQD